MHLFIMTISNQHQQTISSIGLVKNSGNFIENGFLVWRRQREQNIKNPFQSFSICRDMFPDHLRAQNWNRFFRQR